MFGIGFPELIVIFVVALIVLGPERLPEAARSVAKVFLEFRKAADELKKELGADELEESKAEIEKVKRELLEKVYTPLEPDPFNSLTKQKTKEQEAPSTSKILEKDKVENGSKD
ncbi:twin-arginine translocation protein, TatB subunit [Thermodesulfatator indicus DSM 15286]|uniref:Twin-arginine translocation protein, TatB subunit n=1 Tax=Thermodesulfatator indicus (strain DSM 15286 / JCM 11887 / CIR29812) TaxID=667014 RepID=F8A8M7_THEID|nr:Sec-independent protein translocase protein TatB [Thermodesulfatator indicus]AEH45116.1 twin-arginine translocation protein, TatB subunit [Thermodesulfatator indicus DSM 15286]